VLPKEAISHADAVVIGEAEGSWPALVENFRKNSLKKFYSSHPVDLAKAVLPRRDLGIDKRILGLRWPGIYTTRGCPYNCEFCSVSEVYGRKIRHLPVSRVIEDINNAKSKIFIFLDDNVVADPKYSKNLFQALAPMNIQWGSQSTIKIAQDDELLKLCRLSGCRALFIGLESVSPVTMSMMRKTLENTKAVEDTIKKIQDAGILFHPSFVFGFDDHTPAIFDETLEFLYKNKIATATFNILTPYPSTKLYARLKREQRIITEDWSKYDHSTVVFRPKKMTEKELAEGYFQFKKEFYSLSKLCKRVIQLKEISHPGLTQLMYATFNNIAGKETLHESHTSAQNMSS
jgi:radical SAM superfamily enzyme YgiQ (UPF0313 family)